MILKSIYPELVEDEEGKKEIENCNIGKKIGRTGGLFPSKDVRITGCPS